MLDFFKKHVACRPGINRIIRRGKKGTVPRAYLTGWAMRADFSTGNEVSQEESLGTYHGCGVNENRNLRFDRKAGKRGQVQFVRNRASIDADRHGQNLFGLVG
jgi:hypothetical protein